ncbi:hypothetical protein Tco_1383283 [Tanacetum coccineum]
MVLLRGEIYFVQFIINPEEDEFELGLIFRRSFLHAAKGIVNFGEGTTTEKISHTGMAKRGKGSRGSEKRALTHNISMRYEILDEVRPVIETLAYSDKYRKLLDEIWADKVRLDGMIKPEEERVMTSGAYDHKVGSSRAKRSRNVETVKKHYSQMFTTNSWNGEVVVEKQSLVITLAQTEEEVFFSVAWVRAFDIREPIYLELFREFYATYEFDKVGSNLRIRLIPAIQVDEEQRSCRPRESESSAGFDCVIYMRVWVDGLQAGGNREDGVQIVISLG